MVALEGYKYQVSGIREGLGVGSAVFALDWRGGKVLCLAADTCNLEPYPTCYP